MKLGRAGGFTLVEILVAIVILSLGAMAWVGTSRVAATSMRAAALELRAAQLIQEQVERLRTLPLDSVHSGSVARPAGDALWTVADSGSYLRVVLVVRARPEGGRTLSDTVYVYRAR
ncbi:MAG TPA: type II secretion system protein [Longimicrobiales bacterium]|nr:type II secretion system protein [Longimicrobiales bacterium]